MNPTHRTRRLSVTVAAAAAAALALPACQGTAAAASHHHAAHATAQQPQNGLTPTGRKDHAEVKRGLPGIAGQPRVGKAWEHRRKFGGPGPAVSC
jgi:hypothetical protein